MLDLAINILGKKNNEFMWLSTWWIVTNSSQCICVMRSVAGCTPIWSTCFEWNFKTGNDYIAIVNCACHKIGPTWRFDAIEKFVYKSGQNTFNVQVNSTNVRASSCEHWNWIRIKSVETNVCMAYLFAYRYFQLQNPISWTRKERKRKKKKNEKCKLEIFVAKKEIEE